MKGAFDRSAPMMKGVFNGSFAVFDCGFDRGASSLERSSDRWSNAFDYVFYGAGHSDPPTLPLIPKQAQS
jgi:hypothetical protein